MRKLIDYAERGKEGRHWYDNARHAIRAWCKQHTRDFDTYCAVLAITSPRVQVTKNVRITEQYMQADPLWSKGMLKERVKAVLRWEEDGVVRGPKVNAFYLALTGDQEAVVLDTWMARACEIKDKFNKTERLDMETRVRSVALWYDWTPAQTQAAIWCGYQMHIGRNPTEIKVCS